MSSKLHKTLTVQLRFFLLNAVTHMQHAGVWFLASGLHTFNCGTVWQNNSINNVTCSEVHMYNHTIIIFTISYSIKKYKKNSVICCFQWWGITCILHSCLFYLDGMKSRTIKVNDNRVRRNTFSGCQQWALIMYSTHVSKIRN